MKHKITNEQRVKWFLDNKCHICGSDQPHSHPNHMWLAHPVPKLPEDAPLERKEKAEIENMIIRAQMEIVISGKVSQEVKAFYETLNAKNKTT